MKNQKYWLGLQVLATIMLLGLAACEPAELSVEPTPEGAGEVEAPADAPVEGEAEKEGVFDMVYPPVAEMDMEGAVTTDSGLQYLEIIPGQGDTPEDGDIVSMHFIATLPDGTEFTNSYSQGAPVEAILGRGQLLPGWEEGVKLMKAGGQARMQLSPDLAFGPEGYGMIQPDSDIFLTVELISIEPAPQPETVSESDLTTTESGLQYYDLAVGDGKTAVEGNIVSNHFSIWVV